MAFLIEPCSKESNALQELGYMREDESRWRLGNSPIVIEHTEALCLANERIEKDKKRPPRTLGEMEIFYKAMGWD